MDLVKSHWTADENHVRLQMPISKINKERRQVSGFATLDNVDQQGEIVTAAASKSAFSRFRGNIREMHQPIAAGRLVDFREKSFFDNDSQKVYNGIYVTVYVSKGAEATWEKVLDGTLSGFSIGGNISKEETEWNKADGKSVRVIKGFDLYELSLVDNPCNQHANVFSIEKSTQGSFMKGMIADTVIENVFFCTTDSIAYPSKNETEKCLHCGNDMERIGWNEKGGDETAKMQTLVTKFLRQKEDNEAVTKNTGEGGVNMTDENKTDEAVAADVVTSESVEEVASEGAEGAAREGSEDATNSTGDKEETATGESVEEVAGEPDFEKMIDDLHGAVKDTVAQNKEVIEKAVQAVESKISEVTKSFDEQVTEFRTEFEEIKKSLGEVRTEREEVAKRLDTLEKATAIKKSGDVETTDAGTTVQKSLWSGAFFKD